MNYLKSHLSLSIMLVTLSAFFYAVYYFFFRDLHNMMTWVIMDIAFLPVNILIVSLVVEGVITSRDRAVLLKKLNMVIGAFYSEVGTNLLKLLVTFDINAAQVGRHMLFDKEWTSRQFFSAINQIKKSKHIIDSRTGDLAALGAYLTERREFLLRLLENPNLLEHESFSDLLWAVFHLTEELANRNDLFRLPDPDYHHISNDIKRAYTLLLTEWLNYVRHLSEDYPYLFSLAVRTNPFDPEARAEVS